MPFDTVILNGTVVDGTGASRYEADVGISGGRIEAIGALGHAEAERRIDAIGARGGAGVHRHALALRRYSTGGPRR